MKRMFFWRVVVNLAIALMAFVSWGRMFVGENGVLVSRGFGSLKYFTVLSNLFAGGMAVVWLVFAVCRRQMPRAAVVLKFAAAASVGLTFFTVMVFLGPTMGYGKMFAGVSLYMHLIVPLAAAAEWIWLMPERMSFRESMWTVVPMLFYGAFYLGNVLVNGPGTFPRVNDWYGFARWGMPAALVIFAALALATWGIALLLRRGQARRHESKEGENR